jgi:hypothetical protein
MIKAKINLFKKLKKCECNYRKGILNNLDKKK